jgi:hypothetical protein
VGDPFDYAQDRLFAKPEKRLDQDDKAVLEWRHLPPEFASKDLRCYRASLGSIGEITLTGVRCAAGLTTESEGGLTRATIQLLFTGKRDEGCIPIAWVKSAAGAGLKSWLAVSRFASRIFAGIFADLILTGLIFVDQAVSAPDLAKILFPPGER